MAKKKISGLPAGSALNGTELVPIVQTGTTKRITTQDIANLGNASGVEGSGTINRLPKFTASSTIGDSAFFDDGTNQGTETTTAINRFIMSANASIAKIFSFRSANLPRWAFRVDGTESGSNAGADLAIRRYNDAGTYIDSPLFIQRSTGFVGISTTSPAAKLDVNGNGKFLGVGVFGNGLESFGANGGNGIYSVAGGSAGSGVYGFTSDLSSYSGTFEHTGSGAGIALRVLGRANFSLGIGLNSETAGASGIQFPATQVASASANNLDDYEEGTWTMGVSFGGASVGVTYSNNTGTYTKIGRQVTVTGYMSLSNKGSSTGSAKITGLPFSILLNNAYTAASMRFDNITFTNQFQGFGEVGLTIITLEQTTLLGATSNLTDVNFNNSSAVLISLTYFV